MTLLSAHTKLSRTSDTSQIEFYLERKREGEWHWDTKRGKEYTSANSVDTEELGEEGDVTKESREIKQRKGEQ